MDLKEYITSGILENYVFGSVSVQEKQEVECLSHIYPEIKAELTVLQSTIELIAEKYASPPPADLKIKILAQIRTETQNESPRTTIETPVIHLSTPQKNPSRLKWYAAASIVVLIGLGTYTYFIKTNLNASQVEFAVANDSLNTLTSAVSSLQQENEVINDQMRLFTDQLLFLRHQHTRKIELTGTPNYANNLATIFWNNANEKVFLDIKNLPETGEAESYQLWVLIDGVPQDMGVFEIDLNPSTKNTLLEMSSTKNADAFAITREPKGGSLSPTLENLHVIGMI